MLVSLENGSQVLGINGKLPGGCGYHKEAFLYDTSTNIWAENSNLPHSEGLYYSRINRIDKRL